MNIAGSATCGTPELQWMAMNNGAGAMTWEEQSTSQKLLWTAVNSHRTSLGLRAINFSPSLTYVAQKHAIDVAQVLKCTFPPGCNGHTWSGCSVGRRADYYADHRNAAGMWDKPKELTAYTGAGFEIGLFPPFRELASQTQAASCVEGKSGWEWASSKLHYDVVVGQGVWETMTWEALGVGWCPMAVPFSRDGTQFDTFACAWFGKEVDPVKG